MQICLQQYYDIFVEITRYTARKIQRVNSHATDIYTDAKN